MKRHEFATILENKNMAYQQKIDTLNSLLATQGADLEQYRADASYYEVLSRVSAVELIACHAAWEKKYAVVEKRLRVRTVWMGGMLLTLLLILLL